MSEERRQGTQRHSQHERQQKAEELETEQDLITPIGDHRQRGRKSREPGDTEERLSEDTDASEEEERCDRERPSGAGQCCADAQGEERCGDQLAEPAPYEQRVHARSIKPWLGDCSPYEPREEEGEHDGREPGEAERLGCKAGNKPESHAGDKEPDPAEDL